MAMEQTIMHLQESIDRSADFLGWHRPCPYTFMKRIPPAMTWLSARPIAS
jgi:hypothetical protein